MDGQPITRVVRKADHDPRRQLHEETNYGLICEVPGKPGKYVARTHVAIADLTPEQIEQLGVPDNAINAVKRAMETGTPVWWGGNDPLSALRDNLAKDIEALQARLRKLMEETPVAALAKAKVRTDKGRRKVQANWAKCQYIEETGRRRYMRVQILSLRILKGPARHDKKPKRANPEGGNDRLVYFINDKGNRDLEVVSTLDANKSGFREHRHRDGGRTLFILRKDDLVEMAVDPKDADSLRMIYRTVSFSGGDRFDLEFLPVEEARTPKKVPERVRTRITTIKEFRARKPVMVLCDPTGRVRWRGPRLN